MKRYIYISFVIAVIAIGTEYFSREIFLLLISSIMGLAFILHRNKISKKDIKVLFTFILLQLGVILSKLLFTPEIPLLVNIVFVLQLILSGIMLIFIFNKVDIKRSFLFFPSFLYLPHLIGLLLGIANFGVGQFGAIVFGGFHRDPNYLSPDLLFALLSQIFLLLIYAKKEVRILSFFNIALTIGLIMLTGSRTAIMASIIIIILSLPMLKNIVKSKISLIIIITLFGAFISSDFVLKSDRVSYIYDRFTKTEKGSSLEENERYGVWEISYNTIENGELFKGFGEKKFLTQKYRFVSHNVFLNAGIKYGRYTFYSHILLVIVGLGLYIMKFIRGTYRYGLNIPTYFFILCFSEIFMLNSISVSQKHLYWFILVIVLCFGIFRPKFRNNNFI